MFAATLSRFVPRVVVDRTGLMGWFDLDLTWTPDEMAQAPLGSSIVPLPGIDPNRPSIFTAIQEQLGLKLESTKGDVDVLAIDHVERPTPDEATSSSPQLSPSPTVLAEQQQSLPWLRPTSCGAFALSLEDDRGLVRTQARGSHPFPGMKLPLGCLRVAW
jgi:hypothetical protein